MAIVQRTMLYTSKLTWNGGVGVGGEYQRAISRVGRAALEAFRSTPLGIIATKSGHMPARALLNHRQASSHSGFKPDPRTERARRRSSPEMEWPSTPQGSGLLHPDDAVEVQKWGA